MIKKVLKYLPAVIFFLSLFFVIKTLLLPYYPDFSQYYFGLKEIINAVNPYLPGQSFSTVYPPFVLSIFSIFTVLSFFWAQKLWTFLSILLLFSSLYLIFKINKEKMFSGLNLIICSIIFSFYFPVKFTLGMGQINFLILFLTLASIYFFNKNKNNFSGVFLGLSIMIKLFPILFLPYLMILKKWKILFFLISVSAIVLLFTFIINPDVNLYFYKNIAPTLLSGWKTDYYNQSLSGFLGRQMETGFLREVLREIISLVLITVSFLIIWLKNSKKIEVINLSFGLLIILSLLVNNFSWQHHFVWLLFPFITIFNYIKNKKLNWYYYLVLGLSFFLVGFNIKNPNIVPVILISHVFYGALMLWGFNLYLLVKRV